MQLCQTAAGVHWPVETLSIQPKWRWSVSRSGGYWIGRSFVPAWGAARTPIVEALRQND